MSSSAQPVAAYAGRCPATAPCIVCGKPFECGEMAGGHVVRWSKGGKTVPENCQVLCEFDNGSKGNR